MRFFLAFTQTPISLCQCQAVKMNDLVVSQSLSLSFCWVNVASSDPVLFWVSLFQEIVADTLKFLHCLVALASCQVKLVNNWGQLGKRNTMDAASVFGIRVKKSYAEMIWKGQKTWEARPAKSVQKVRPGTHIQFHWCGSDRLLCEVLQKETFCDVPTMLESKGVDAFLGSDISLDKACVVWRELSKALLPFQF